MVLPVTQTTEHLLGPGGAGDHVLDVDLGQRDRVTELLHTAGGDVPVPAALEAVREWRGGAEGVPPLSLHVSHHLHTSGRQAGVTRLAHGPHRDPVHGEGLQAGDGEAGLVHS